MQLTNTADYVLYPWVSILKHLFYLDLTNPCHNNKNTTILSLAAEKYRVIILKPL